MADLAIYDEARRASERLLNGGNKELEAELAVLCMDKALVHWTADDMPGALGEYDRAIELRERLVQQEGRRELANSLAMLGLDMHRTHAVNIEPKTTGMNFAEEHL